MNRSMARGQAAVEFTLGMLVFITVLVFGIHFGEASYLSAKVHEAGAAAIWDSTAYRSYSINSYGDSNLIAAPTAQANTAARYADWDGRASVARTAPVMALTKADPMVVTCTAGAGVAAYNLPPLAPGFIEPGGVSCNARGDFNVFRISTNFLEGPNGFFRAPHNSRPLGSPTSLCAAGRSLGGVCPGSLSVLLGDDALTDPNNESDYCDLQTDSPRNCVNRTFYQLTETTFDNSMRITAGWASGYTGAPERWAKNIVGGRGIPGGRITGFYMSFWGDESGFIEPLMAGPLRGGTWQSNPMDAPVPAPSYRQGYTLRQGCSAGAFSAITGSSYCFLGKFPCN